MDNQDAWKRRLTNTLLNNKVIERTNQDKLQNAITFISKEFSSIQKFDTNNSRLYNELENPILAINLGNILKIFKEKLDKDSYDILIKKLTDNNKFDEGITFLDFCYSFIKKDFSIRVIKESKRLYEKTPDIKIYKKGNFAYIEFSELQFSKIEQVIDKSITSDFIAKRLEFSGWVNFAAKDTTEKDIQKDFKNFSEDVSTKRCFCHKKLERVYEIAAAPFGDKKLSKWVNENGLSANSIAYVDFGINKVDYRVQRKIIEKTCQIPKKQLGIIILYGRTFVHYSCKNLPNLEFIKELIPDNIFLIDFANLSADTPRSYLVNKPYIYKNYNIKSKLSKFQLEISNILKSHKFKNLNTKILD